MFLQPHTSEHISDVFFLIFSAGNESCPQPQTSEHLAAVEIMKLKHILILQNKIDLVKESQAKEQYEQILAFVKGKEKIVGYAHLQSNLPMLSPVLKGHVFLVLS